MRLLALLLVVIDCSATPQDAPCAKCHKVQSDKFYGHAGQHGSSMAKALYTVAEADILIKTQSSPSSSASTVIGSNAVAMSRSTASRTTKTNSNSPSDLPSDKGLLAKPTSSSTKANSMKAASAFIKSLEAWT